MKEKGKKLLKGKEGITLIALVITIIVLLILAGVAISMLTGDNGILTIAATSKDETEKAAVQEAISLAYMNALTQYYEDGTSIITTMQEELEDKYGEGNVTITYSDGVYTVTIDGTEYTIDGAGTVTTEDEDTITPTEDSVADESTEFSTAYGTVEVIWLSGTSNEVTSTPNEPELTSNGESMTAVTWTYDEDSGEWTEDETASSDWHSYTAVSTRDDDGTLTDNVTSKWANAKTENGSYFVWIPRYAYRITYYESETSTEPTGYYDGWGMWNAEDGTVKYALDDGIETVTYNGNKYIVHPAFETDLDLGGWSEDLTGFWFAKYEMTGSSTSLTSVPNTASLRSMTIGAQYVAARSATYGYTGTSETLSSGGTDYTYTSYMSSHMVKNSEWGAVAYLTQSQYGRNGNEIDINNSSSYITGNGGGAVGGSVSSASGTTNAYNTETGAKASTTGNVYGIYDMSGGAWEYVASYDSLSTSTYMTGSSYGLYLTQEAQDDDGNYISTKYITAYSNGTSTYYGTTIYTIGKVGDATKEVYTGSSYYSWFSDYAYFVFASWPFCIRGGTYYFGSSAGVFYSFSTDGNSSTYYSFRAVLCP